MELVRRLETLKEETMKKIQAAASKANTLRIKHLSGIADRIENDERTIAAVIERIAAYEKDLNNSEATHLPTPNISIDHPVMQSRHATGSNARAQFVENCARRGTNLTQLNGKVFQTGSGKRVVIAFASELESKPGRWWLGVKDATYDVVVLLCRPVNGKTLEFVLPNQFLTKLWGSLSRSGHEVKFNLLQETGNYYLLVPPQRRESINHFAENYGPIR